MAALEEALVSIKRIQDFEVSSLPRVEDLGLEVNFQDAVAPAKRLIDLYCRVSLEALADYPDVKLNLLKERANTDYSYFNNILKFKFQGQGNPESVKNSYIQQIQNAYQETFDLFSPVISYSACRTTDFRLIEQQARGVFQGIRDDSDGLKKELKNSKEEASNILEEVRKVAAEQGVSQQAIYFKNETDAHKKESKKWQAYTVAAATILVLASVGMLLLSKWEWISPKDSYSSIQMVSSKVFIYATLSYLLFMCGKNFLSHKHNEIVNRHRQNALMTYKAIVDASGTPEGKELVLAQAAYCMFNPQETGYIKVVPGESAMKSFVDSLPKTPVRIES